MIIRFFLLLVLGLASPALGQSVSSCDRDTSEYDAIPEPWSDHTRSFSEGRVRLAVLDMIEPAAGAFHLLVLSPPFNHGARTCQIISSPYGAGFAAMDFAALTADYNPAVGLMFSLPVKLMNADGMFDDFTLNFSLNQATGVITAVMQ